MERTLERLRNTSGALLRLVLFAWLAATAAFLLGNQPAARAMSPPAGIYLQTEESAPVTHPPTDMACQSCHSETDEEIVFPSGETLPVRVDPADLGSPVHGTAEDPVSCSGCHLANEYQFPHSPVEAADLRSYQIARAESCEGCHTDPHLTAHPGPESENPVICTDCHVAHAVQTADYWQTSAATATCVSCHQNENVELVDSATLSRRIEDGLFVQQRVNVDFCLACHGPPGQTMTLANGDEISISVDPEAMHGSVHGEDNSWQTLVCNDCHEGYDFPHEPLTIPSAREYTIEQSLACGRCHETQHEGALESVHAEALAEGNLESAVCADCHSPHDTPVPNDPRARISATCQQCHSTIYDEYAESVHGESLLVDDNPDVPTCIDCHGVHSISDPTTNLFRNRSPQLCAGCHADEELMAEYDISTHVFESYVEDFHGATVSLFEQSDPNAETNKAVCYDCHGVHNIKRPDDPEAGIKANLLETCQQCHPDATEDFPDSWTGHHEPSLEENPLLALVNLFYLIAIPATVGSLGFLVGTDLYRRARGR